MASRYLAIRYDRVLCAAKGRLPKGRRACLQDALKGAAEDALLEAQVIVMALFGMSVAAIAKLVHETAHAHMVPAGQGGIAGEGCRRLGETALP